MIDITIIAQAKTFGTRRKLLARADKLTRGAKIKLFGRTDDTRLAHASIRAQTKIFLRAEIAEKNLDDSLATNLGSNLLSLR